MSAPTQERRRPDASMSLINELLNRPIDPGYEAVAERRRATGETVAQRPTSMLAVVTVLVIGLIFGISATNLGARTTERSSARADLVAQIDARKERVEANSARVSELQSEVAAAQEEVIRGTTGGVAAGLTNGLLATAGALAVEGPGISVTMDDAPIQPGADAATISQSKVRSRDIQIVVNALWASGAEAIDVGGQRLTSRSAIRFAGEAILVNYRPLPRPYVIRAIGDPDRLTSDFAGGDGGAYLKALSDNLGIKVSAATETHIDMTSASALRIEHAQPLREDADAPSPSEPTRDEQ